LVFDLSQLLAQACGFGAMLRCLGVELDSRDAASRIEKLGHSIVLAFAGMFELIGKIVLVLGVALQSGDLTLQILDFGPVPSPREGSIVDGQGGVLPRTTAAFP
jgi:hypothetical protein